MYETNRVEVSRHVRDKQGRGLMSCTRQTEQRSHVMYETNRVEVSCHVRDKQGRGLTSCTRQTG